MPGAEVSKVPLSPEPPLGRDPAGALRHIEALTAGVSRRAAMQRTLLPGPQPEGAPLHGLSLPALLWGFYDEFGGENLAPAWDQAGRASCARLFVVSASVVTSRLWEAERAGLVGTWSTGGARRVALKVREPEALTRLLLSGPVK